METPEGVEKRLVMAPWTTAWRGSTTSPNDLPVGAQVILRTQRAGRVVDRIWADVTRVNGIILSINGGPKDRTVEVDCGPHRGRRTVSIPYQTSGRIQVRHPQFEPGYLFDVIGLREEGVVSARTPATSQPPYKATAIPPASRVYGSVPSRISGTATWYDAYFENGNRGAAYPMLEEADTGCADGGVSCAGLPYLAIGSLLYVRNVCTGRAAAVPIVECGCLTGKFCDRCVECGTSPRGRIVDLPPTTFVELGGDLTSGCFNARIGLG
ncbi:hypothetical protein [Rhizohabitans arisaemae]|uniref:hypothetical protein n=1 Tax=Rhizohabitans arisaemae TaxID=2720610 RepID=UPI0024B222C0|nr:hypothetical protein [Rhizohabitans arisaemae]